MLLLVLYNTQSHNKGLTKLARLRAQKSVIHISTFLELQMGGLNSTDKFVKTSL